MLRLTTNLFDCDVVEEAAFTYWKEELDEDYKGKVGRGLIFYFVSSNSFLSSITARN